PRGFGFVKAQTDAGEVSAFVTPPDLNAFLDGDVVTAVFTEDASGRFTASNLALVERARSELFGSAVTRGRGRFLKVDRRVTNTDWPFEDALEGVADGAFVVGEIRGRSVAPARVLGPSADVGVERVIVRHGIRSTFSEDLLAAAAEARRAPRVGDR